ncbi:MAG: aconitate hydratase [Nitrospiraceae bacterium]|nr:aconitate hydratase [Nitrospiraceae bacterium]
MKKNLVRKIFEKHVTDGRMETGEEVSIRIDQTLTQDATGTMAYLEFEAMGIPRVKTELSVSYVDHNTLQTDFRNADDHRFLQSTAARYGIYFSRPGNGICHQVQLERFAIPGKTLLGSDSHTPTAGGVGMLAIGAGGLNVAAAMAGEPFTLKYPKIVGVKLTGELPEWVSAKDVILELLRRVDVKGGVGKIFEYFGPGLRSLDVPGRATITNMGAETGATTSIFPSDEITRKWLEAQGRGAEWVSLKADEGAEYDDIIEIELGELEPMIAMPHSPGNVRPISEAAGMEIQQVAIGSCTNSSLRDMKIVANILKGHKVAENLHLLINPGSRQVVEHLVESGEYDYLVDAGARILENACGPCIGMGGAPPSGSATLRTYNRNFEGRSGTKDARIMLVSPEVAAVSAIKGIITDPREFGRAPKIEMPERFIITENMIIPPLPPEKAKKVEIIRGPNIRPLPDFPPLPDVLKGEVLIKVGDNITTDHIMPAGAKILPLRSNIPEISKYVYSGVDPDFYSRAVEKSGGFIVGGENYGQGSSREHAAIAPKYLGIKAVLAKSFSRIHRSNLINFGILPMICDTDLIEQGDILEIRPELRGKARLVNRTKGSEIPVKHDLSEKEIGIMEAGGLLPHIKNKRR